MNNGEMHKAQASILRMLRHTPSARFSELMKPTGMESAVFKFHIRKLIHLKYLQKLENGNYTLTATGKEFANNLDRNRKRSVLKQPKLSVAVIALRETDGNREFLFQKRLRNPYYGFWGCISGPVQWGESFEDAGAREFEKQTGLTAEYFVRSFYRKTDYNSESDELLEDKLFAIVEAVGACEELRKVWPRGINQWMSVNELKLQDKFYVSTLDFIQMVETGVSYSSKTYRYSSEEY